MTPSSIISVVVLPAPFGPRSATRSPTPTVRSTPSTARTRLYCFTSPRRRGGRAREQPRVGLGHAVSVARAAAARRRADTRARQTGASQETEESVMGVLDGVKVVELAEHGFVPSCGAILADWGADVVKIERPTGDPLRAIMGAGLRRRHRRLQLPVGALQPQQARHRARPARRPRGAPCSTGSSSTPTSSSPTSSRRRARSCARTPRTCWQVNPRLVYAKGHGQGQRGPDADARRLRRESLLVARRHRPHPHAARRRRW